MHSDGLFDMFPNQFRFVGEYLSILFSQFWEQQGRQHLLYFNARYLARYSVLPRVIDPGPATKERLCP